MSTHALVFYLYSHAIIRVVIETHTGVAQVGLVSRCLVANILGGVVDVLVCLAETGGGDALVRDSLSRHVDAEVLCSLICSGW